VSYSNSSISITNQLMTCRQKQLAKQAEVERIKQERDVIFQALPKWKQDIIMRKQNENQP